MAKRVCVGLFFGALAALCVGRLTRAQQTQISPDVYNEMKFRYIGPVGNRATAVVGIPGNPSVYYVGAASGGIFKSTDGGIHWDPIFDDEPVSSIGSLAIAASDPNIVWAGTGESFIRSHISVGNGIYKSLDAGKTWKRMGLEKTGRIANVIVDPHNPDIVLACALGHAYGPQPDRGVFRTADGGKNWEKVLFVDENTGCSDMGMDPNNPRTLFAGMWQLEIHTYGRKSGGPGSGLFKSTDDGATWKRLEAHGLPHSPLGDRYVSILSDLGEGLGWVAAGVAIAWMGGHKGRRAGLATALTSLATTYLVQQRIKPMFRRRRPFVGRDVLVVGIKTEDASFPSGHTASSFAAATALSTFYPRASPLVFALAAGVGVSRVHLGHHFPSDVVAGSLIGIATGTLTAWLVRLAKAA
jgi:acid phosphatase family membrane protein YuiD